MDRPLTALFIDCDSFFASVEQHLNPALRGRPVGVAPVMAETSCCIAATYEAKAFGVKTGTRISDARIMCPGIAIVEAQPPEYIKIHHRIIEAVEDCIHVEAVLSIDEMWAWLPFNWREPEFVREIGRKIKATVARATSRRSSRFPSGRVPTNTSPKWPARCVSRTGYSSSRGGVMGDRLWHLLRGDEIPDIVSAKNSIGHSHVLPPTSRHPDAAWPILCKLLHKACERLRSHGLLTGSLTMQLAFFRGVTWGPEIRFPETDSTIFVMRALDRIWKERSEPRSPLLQVCVVLTRLSSTTFFAAATSLVK